jgi:hypothetical protein
MKLELLRRLQEHEAQHPRPSIAKLLYAPRTVIVFPYGYGYKVGAGSLWDTFMFAEKKNDAGVEYRKVEAAGISAGIACARAGEDFDFTVDMGQSLKGYRRIIRVGLDGKVTDSRPQPAAGKR